MGAGKSAVCERLKKDLPASVFLDGDWCWNADPFVVNDETKAMVLDNICYLLNSFLHCRAYENVIFCWVMHEQEIIDALLAKLDLWLCAGVVCVSLTADEETIRARLRADIDAGLREEGVIARSLERLPLYEKLSTVKIDTSGLSAAQAAEKVKALAAKKR